MEETSLPQDASGRMTEYVPARHCQKRHLSPGCWVTSADRAWVQKREGSRACAETSCQSQRPWEGIQAEPCHPAPQRKHGKTELVEVGFYFKFWRHEAWTSPCCLGRQEGKILYITNTNNGSTPTVVSRKHICSPQATMQQIGTSDIHVRGQWHCTANAAPPIFIHLLENQI